MRGFKLGDIWDQNHTKTFLALKAHLVAEPVLSSPHYDGTPFILTTDGCKDAFTGVLAQEITTTLPGGKGVRSLHPIAFMSKRTSITEKKYKFFSLEFAALEFSFDKFSDIVYEYLVKVKTDCQALHDVLMNDKLSATHARWQDSILAHNIVDVQHIPGVMNIADGLSCKYKDTPRSNSNGSSWTISLDWEKQRGFTFEVNQVAVDSDGALLKWFEDEPMFKGIIEAIYGIWSGLSLCECKKAQHWATNYMIEDGRLWYVGGRTLTRAISQRECITQREVVELA